MRCGWRGFSLPETCGDGQMEGQQPRSAFSARACFADRRPFDWPSDGGGACAHSRSSAQALGTIPPE
jgi:hypothetical protein